MKAIVTVGLGFGDEGKGATVDYFARRFDADLVVRYSGGAQAGHNVQLPDGRRHTFSQFGAGTFAGASTYLDRNVIVNPATLTPEADHLVAMGVHEPKSTLAVHRDCLLTSWVQVLVNRLRERERGKQRHGSCGLGVGETRRYALQNREHAIVASDLLDRSILIEKLQRLKCSLLSECEPLLKRGNELSESVLEFDCFTEAEILIGEMEGVRLVEEIPSVSVAIFEGSQGILLDEDYGFHPYTTWSKVTTQHAMELIESSKIDDFKVYGITRAYSTRHGAGPFPTCCPTMSQRLSDPGNPSNPWQGTMNAGPLDLNLLRYAAASCKLDSLVVNHLDELTGPVPFCDRYANAVSLNLPGSIQAQEALTNQLLVADPMIQHGSVDELMDRLEQVLPVEITADGPTYLHRQTAAPNSMAAPNNSAASKNTVSRINGVSSDCGDDRMS